MSIAVSADFAEEVSEAGPTQIWDDLSRNVYCVLGSPIDAIDMRGLITAIDNAATHKRRLLISTVNLNFLMNSRSDPEFRNTLLLSELCSADGAAVVWIARLIGLPIKERVAGSDLFESLGTRGAAAPRLKLFIFGGPDGVAKAAAKALNESQCGLTCVGYLYPGYGDVEDMSQERIIAEINDSRADFLVAALGAQKGQSWLARNNDRLTVPIRAHLGASINFAAGKIQRAPALLRRLGLEWLWRIKEEPHLWRRYWHDGRKLLGLLLTQIIPLAALERWAHFYERVWPKLQIECAADQTPLSLDLSGTATRRNVQIASARFRDLAAPNRTIRINLAKTSMIDARFLGLLLMLNKQVKKRDAELVFTGASYLLRAIFCLNGAGFLLERSEGV